ncbi:Gfo/Idh/MocA family protein [Paenibacillus sp. GCM10012307]|uniref:Gfo/Idh/MocA family oxidoreductase n=1 Tax=Paenibacillus roseus TaxID=2798579 RepID=A0A934J4G8_9BACL|nr:Gfo/Idh/MocA family oxidoreductase [Paenibacillus roseus]MBJ6360651.1 Gfo/Idh/MocA family oxidoreductase [Paenibacillus roseus]
MVRFGVIGTNWITESFIQAASLLESFRLTAVYSRTEERGAEFAARYGATHVFTDLEAMAASNELDAVYIASPNCYHAQQAIVLLRHGKHVLCEKPIASNEREVQAMMDAAAESGAVLMEAMKSTLLPNFRAIQDNLHKIGPIRRYTASYCQYSSRYDAYKNGTVLNAFNPVYSNGSMMDLGIYCLYPMIVLFGEPQSIQASAYMLESGVDGEGSVIATYADMQAVIMHSKISASSLPSEIQGELGSIIVDKISEIGHVEIRYRDGTIEKISVPQQDQAMIYEAKEFIELVENGEKQSRNNSHRHSRLTMKWIDEIRRQIGLVYPADAR